MTQDSRCRVVRPCAPSQGKQGLGYAVGVSAETTGAQAIHLQVVTIPPGAAGAAHRHAGHETAIYALSGRSGCWWGETLQHHDWVKAGEYFYIPPGMPHLPYNPSRDTPFVAVIARTDPKEQEGVELMAHLQPPASPA
ncbi:cupin domain-containing protein [Caulobacter segnis]|uniref:cupin domain-containing protein n=1 Tax=Caulobacter segnis TaxID=88688 RepID=UPI002410568D|nr:cupin domain-containing protein [Caulobacter segnis]MDG2520467.1 cupin domain-containing protein [Caulobacter segnis]